MKCLFLFYWCCVNVILLIEFDSYMVITIFCRNEGVIVYSDYGLSEGEVDNRWQLNRMNQLESVGVANHVIIMI